MSPYGTSVTQDWIFALPFQQQTVLLLACRGPDGVNKDHPTKNIIRRYRGSILKQARTGRAATLDDTGNNFIDMSGFAIHRVWASYMQSFFDHVDSIPHHCYLHLAHGAEILAYRHPELLFRQNWWMFYTACCDNLHMHPETLEQLDERLNDWNREDWDVAKE